MIQQEQDYICDREQCRYEGKPNLPTTARKWSLSIVGGIFILAGILSIVFIIGIFPLLVGGAMLYWAFRVSCPACRRGQMLSTTHNPRGRALKARKMM